MLTIHNPATRLPGRTLALSALTLLSATLLATGCDIVTADLKHAATSEWRKTYTLDPGGRVEISNVNGRIRVEPSEGSQVEVIAEKKGRGVSEDAAKAAAERIEIKESVSPSSIRIETKTAQKSGGMFSGSVEVTYSVRVPASADVTFTTVNGGIELSRLTGRIHAETTNGAVTARDVGGPIEARTTNGGVEVELTQVRGAVTLSCTNGGIKLRLPADAAATISASVSNGGVEASGLKLTTTEQSRRRLEATLNGGGPEIRIEGTNGGIRIAAR